MSSDVIAMIDATVGELCACGCGTRLALDGPSAWYASPACQRRYLARRATGVDEVQGRPDAALVLAGRDDARIPLREPGGAGSVFDDWLTGFAAERTLISPPRIMMPELAPADPHRSRIDLVYVDADGNRVVATGTPADHPQPPALPAGARYTLARVHVPAGATAVSAAHLAQRRLTQIAMPEGFDPEAIRAAVEAAGRRLAEACGPWQSMFEELGRRMQRLAEEVRPMVPAQPPEDPMERALWLRRNRNTGPKPPARAPRRIDPRRTR